jgi:hypothetical protein
MFTNYFLMFDSTLLLHLSRHPIKIATFSYHSFGVAMAYVPCLLSLDTDIQLKLPPSCITHFALTCQILDPHTLFMIQKVVRHLFLCSFGQTFVYITMYMVVVPPHIPSGCILLSHSPMCLCKRISLHFNSPYPRDPCLVYPLAHSLA